MKTNLEVECSPWLDEAGAIEVGVYFGTTCEPSLEECFSLKKMVDNTLYSMTVGNKIADNHFDDVEKLLTSLDDLYKYAKTRAEELDWS